MFYLYLFITALFLLLGVFLSKGKGAFLIAGYNTTSKEKKKKIDELKLCRFVSVLMFVLAICWLIMAISIKINSDLLHYVGLALFLIAVLAGVIYANTGKRFMR